MEEVRDRARLVDAGAVASRGITATVPRSEIEDVLRSEEGSPELVLDLVRRDNGDVEAHSLRLEWDPGELQELLRRAEGDEVTLLFDGVELEKVFDDLDVEAHGLRERAVVLAVAATAAAGAATHASAMPILSGGDVGGSAAPIAMVSDAASSGPVAPAQTPELVSDAGSGGLQHQTSVAQGPSSLAAIENAAAHSPELVSDNALSGPAAAVNSPELVSDNALSGPQSVEAASVAQGPSSLEAIETAANSSPQLVSDNALSGPQSVVAASVAQGPSSLEAIETAAANSPQLVSDNALSGPQSVEAASVAQGPSSLEAIEATGAQSPEVVSDNALSGPQPAQAASVQTASGGGTQISAPSAETTGAIVGGALLAITAAFATRRRRSGGGPRPA